MNAEKRIQDKLEAGQISPDDADILKRIAHDCDIAAMGYEIGKLDGKSIAYRSVASHLRMQAGLPMHANDRSLEIMASLFDAMAAEGQEDEDGKS
jgi:hypothetical protein